MHCFFSIKLIVSGYEVVAIYPLGGTAGDLFFNAVVKFCANVRLEKANENADPERVN